MPASCSTERCRGAALARALFDPACVAIVGSATDPFALASRPVRVLARHGYRGRVLAFAQGRELQASPPAAADRGGCNIDHAFVMVPAIAVAAALRACAGAGVRVATICTAGFAETGGRGRERQQAIVDAARAAGLRILGPNSLGVLDAHSQLALTANAVFEHEPLHPGELSLVSHSGSMLGGIVTRAQERGFGFSKLISVGNEADIAVGELVDLLVDDPRTGAILLFLEAFRDAPVLAAAARRAYAAGKPVIAYKLGRSQIGRALAVTHTGAIATEDAAADAFLRTHGILRVRTLEALFEAVPLLRRQRPPKARRVGVVTVSGAAATMVVDRLASAGIDIAPPPAATLAALAPYRIRASASPVIDLPMGRADRGAFAAAVAALQASAHCDLVLAVQGSNAAHEPDSVRSRILAVAERDKPLAVFVGPRADAALALLQQAGVAGFRTPESCADAIEAYCRWRAPQQPAWVDPAAIGRADAALRDAGGGVLSEHASARVLAALGVPVSPGCLLRDPAEAARLPFAFPVVAKICSPDIAHKARAGGVGLGLADVESLRAAVNRLLERARSACPQARIEGVLVQPMHTGSEVLVGFRRDPDLGPLVTLALGGALTGMDLGRALELAPVSRETALSMVSSLPLLGEQIDRCAASSEPLAAIVQRMSWLAAVDAVTEAEANPVMVSAAGAVAVDALLRTG